MADMGILTLIFGLVAANLLLKVPYWRQFYEEKLKLANVDLESVSGRPTYARYITDLRPTDHLPSVAEMRPTGPRTLPDKTDTTPTYNRQTTDNLSRRGLSNIFERILPYKFVCPHINQHQTDKTESIPIVNRSLPDFHDLCRFEVGFVSVWPVWLGYQDETEWKAYGRRHFQFNVLKLIRKLLHFESTKVCFFGLGDWLVCVIRPRLNIIWLTQAIVTDTQQYITVTSYRAQWLLNLPASRLFAQPFVQAPIKENIKAPCLWPLWGEPPVIGGFPSQFQEISPRDLASWLDPWWWHWTPNGS